MSHIPRLLLKAVHCVTDTDENGGESPYFLITVGSRGSSPKLFNVISRIPAWDNRFDRGVRLTTNQLVASRELSGCPDLTTGSLVLITMLEEDDGLDLTDGTANFINLMLTPHWLNYGGPNWSGASLANVGEIMALRVRTAVQASLGNDDYMGTRRLGLSNQDGDLPLLSFSGDGGLYRVRFANEGLGS